MTPPLGVQKPIEIQVYRGKPHYLRLVDEEQEKLLDRLLLFLAHNDMNFYTIEDIIEGNKRVVKVHISLKLT